MGGGGFAATHSKARDHAVFIGTSPRSSCRQPPRLRSMSGMTVVCGDGASIYLKEPIGRPSTGPWVKCTDELGEAYPAPTVPQQ